MIRNPVLPGFNPDPSFCRAGDDYYLATSTFEWFPGVQIHHSRDLVNWTLVSRPLTRVAQLDMRGNPDSGGIWAPCLSHADGKFWLVYTDVKRLDGKFKDAHNYIVTCDTIDGDWSDPVYCNSSGFDPSLFHDDDGRKWFVNQQWNHRGSGTGGNPVHDSFDGILLQEYMHPQGLTGEIKMIDPGSPHGLTEAPHLFKRNGYYYLTVAEGGTGYNHVVSLARSKNLDGPYEYHPDIHILTAKDAPDSPIQRVGHGQYVETPDGQHYHSFLMGRPIPGPDGKGRFCPLGRESGLERMVWRDDWLYAETGSPVPRESLPGLTDAEPQKPQPIRHKFTDKLPMDFQWLRTPHPERLFTLTGSALRLTGRESIGSWFEQSLVARRQEHLAYRAETTVENFAPTTYQHGAGLTTYYNRTKFHAAIISTEGAGRTLTIFSCPGDYPDGRMDNLFSIEIEDGPTELAVDVDHATQQFYVKQSGEWRAVGPILDASVISDEGGRGEHGSFTGAFVGMIAFDITGQGKTADFPRFDYLPNERGNDV